MQFFRREVGQEIGAHCRQWVLVVSRVRLAVGWVLRYHPGTKRLFRRLRAGDGFVTGEVHFFRFRLGFWMEVPE